MGLYGNMKMKKFSLHGLFIIFVVLLFMGLTSIQLAKTNTAVKAISGERLMTYTGLCKSYNEIEQISRTRSVLCTFQMDNNTTLKLYGGILRTNPETLNLLKESENVPFTYQYIDVHVLWEHDYWVVNIQQADRTIIKLEDSLKYYENGVRLYRFYVISALLILFCVLTGFLLLYIITRSNFSIYSRKKNKTEKRSRKKKLRYRSIY